MLERTEAQAKQIEEHTGVPPEGLEDDDLSEAMHELGIPDVEADPSELGQGAPLPGAKEEARRPSRPRYLVPGTHSGARAVMLCPR